VNNKYSSFRQAHFSDMKEIFRRIKFMGGPGAVALTRCHDADREGVCCNLTTRNTRYLFTYPMGTQVQKYPNVRVLDIIIVVKYNFQIS